MKATVPQSVKEAEGEALKTLVDAYVPGRQALAEACGISTSYLSQMLSGHRPIHLATAAALAAALRATIGSFSPRLELLAASARDLPENGPNRSVPQINQLPAANGARWPFDPDLYRRFEHLSKDQKRDVEEALEDHVSRLERRSRPPRKSKAG